MTSRMMVSAAFAASVLVSTLALAGPAGSPPGAGMKRAAATPEATVGPKKLVNTWIGSGNGNNAALPQFVYTTIETTVVNCANAAGCTIGIESMAQIKPQSADWAICLRVDGVSASCQYQGNLQGPSGYVIGNARGVKTGITTGSHTVTTQLYVEGVGATYAAYQTDVRVYKP